jgi:hypothetical protein
MSKKHIPDTHLIAVCLMGDTRRCSFLRKDCDGLPICAKSDEKLRVGVIVSQYGKTLFDNCTGPPNFAPLPVSEK